MLDSTHSLPTCCESVPSIATPTKLITLNIIHQGVGRRVRGAGRTLCSRVRVLLRPDDPLDLACLSKALNSDSNITRICICQRLYELFTQKFLQEEGARK